MTAVRPGLILVALLASPCFFYAQGAAPDKKPQNAQMQEDIEIMRRILNRALDLPRYNHQYVNAGQGTNFLQPYVPGSSNPLGGPGPVYQWDSWNPTNNQPRVLWPNNTMALASTLTFPSAEGVYLKGHGVVYTVVLPPQPDLKLSAPAPTADKPLSEWDRVRKEVRGEKVDETAKPKKNRTVPDILLKVLAENGTHLSQLGPDETVTIVVTFHNSESPKNLGPNQDALGNPIPSSMEPRNVDPLQVPIGTTQVADSLTRLIRTTVESDTIAKGTEGKEVVDSKSKEVPAAVKDNILLGELNFKQGKYKEAEKAYLTALKLLENTPDDGALGQVYHGLAQCYLAVDRTEDARNYLEKAIALDKKKQSEPNPPKKETTAPVATKLIVSAPKKLLDQVGSGKMTFEEFRKEVSMEQIMGAEK
jgi:tetratricopeptide (TPR) repeat protein